MASSADITSLAKAGKLKEVEAILRVNPQVFDKRDEVH